LAFLLWGISKSKKEENSYKR